MFGEEFKENVIENIDINKNWIANNKGKALCAT